MQLQKQQLPASTDLLVGAQLAFAEGGLNHLRNQSCQNLYMYNCLDSQVEGLMLFVQ